MDKPRRSSEYYADKLETLRDLWGTPTLSLTSDGVVVRGRCYPIIDDVIILLDPSQRPPQISHRLTRDGRKATTSQFASEIQSTFGAEWKAFPDIIPEHGRVFKKYFDLLDLATMQTWRVCDLGCGNGRWSYFLQDRCKELVLLDFSEAIFVARRNLRGVSNALFFMGDLTRLPFRDDFANLIVCLGVLHHLPTPALAEVEALRRFAPRLLIYLYYALDNRPIYFRYLLSLVNGIRLALSRHVHRPLPRSVLTWALAGSLYLPLIGLGYLLRPVGWHRHVPLHETYAGRSFQGICQDVYDRFFTGIEQRHSRREILRLAEIFSTLVVSDNPPYWHFYCER